MKIVPLREIVVVGMGPGPVGMLTVEAREALLAEDEIYFRISGHPVYHWLRELGKQCVSFDFLYGCPGMTYEKLHILIVDSLKVAARKKGKVVYALPGNPRAFEKTPSLLEARAKGTAIRIIGGMSFLDTMFIELGLDPEMGLQILNASAFGVYGDYPFTEELPMLIGQFASPGGLRPGDENGNAAATVRALLKKLPPTHEVTLVWCPGFPDFVNIKETMTLKELASRVGCVKELATLYVPALTPPWEAARKVAGTERS